MRCRTKIYAEDRELDSHSLMWIWYGYRTHFGHIVQWDAVDGTAIKLPDKLRSESEREFW